MYVGCPMMTADGKIGEMRSEEIACSGDHGTRAKCRNVGVIELQGRIRKFVKPCQLNVLADLEYRCILGVDFISGSKILLDFDWKSLAIPDSKIEKIVTPIDEENLDIDLIKTGLDVSQKQELQDLFHSFKGLFSDKPELTHVLYYEIDTGDKPPVVPRRLCTI
ncbi:uncharacterized protein TNCV_3874991 [Trichonephila clavipes]|nr:uncharacterized protein TNCV_3874991 [Trichonephila clavipes]